MRTRAEIDTLKADWARDPEWEIEETEGFEDHKPELLAYRLECEAKWKLEAEHRHRARLHALIEPAMQSLLAAKGRGAGPQLVKADFLVALSQALLPLADRIDRLERDLAAEKQRLEDVADEFHKDKTRRGR